MKKINLLMIILVLISACSNSGDDLTPPTPENSAPSEVTSLTFPTDNLLCTTNVLDFEWAAATDPDGDLVSYTLEISKDNLFTSIAITETTSNTSKTVTLEKGVAYYWRIKVIDSKGAESDYSQAYQFYTEGEGIINHLPFSPRLISPEINASIASASTNLEWSCSDVDNDPLVFDVYLDTVNPPVAIVSNDTSDKILNVNLTPATTYYWKIIAKDTNEGESIGQVWSFSSN